MRIKTKTLDELEAERPEDFRNPTQTQEWESKNQRRLEAQWIANELLPDVPEEEEEDVPEEEEEEVSDDENQ